MNHILLNRFIWKAFNGSYGCYKINSRRSIYCCLVASFAWLINQFHCQAKVQRGTRNNVLAIIPLMLLVKTKQSTYVNLNAYSLEKHIWLLPCYSEDKAALETFKCQRKAQSPCNSSNQHQRKPTIRLKSTLLRNSWHGRKTNLKL